MNERQRQAWDSIVGQLWSGEKPKWPWTRLTPLAELGHQIGFHPGPLAGYDPGQRPVVFREYHQQVPRSGVDNCGRVVVEAVFAASGVCPSSVVERVPPFVHHDIGGVVSEV